MPLSARSVATAAAGTRPRRLSDERGLYLLVQPSGAKWWRFDYTIYGRRKTLSLGTYPDVSLAKAREKRDEARRLVVDDIDPSVDRRQKRHALRTDTLQAIADEWTAQQAKT